jgi:hypothetical protein
MSTAKRIRQKFIWTAVNVVAVAHAYAFQQSDVQQFGLMRFRIPRDWVRKDVTANRYTIVPSSGANVAINLFHWPPTVHRLPRNF